MAVGSKASSPTSQRVYGLPQIDPAACAACDIAQRYRSLIEAAPSVIVCLSPDYRILEFNRAAERFYGRQLKTVLGQDYIELFVPEAHQLAVAAEIKCILDGHPAQGLENTIRTSDGSERVLLWSVSRILDAAGQPSGVIAVGQDISERKQGEETLRRYENIVRTSGDLMAFVNKDYVYQAVNVSYVHAFGKTRDQMVGHKVADLYGEEVFRSQIKPNLDRCLAGESVRYQTWRNTPLLGSRFMDVQQNPFRDSDGSVSGVVVASRDITEQWQVEQALVEHQQRLRALASELALAEQRERRRVAVGLHDHVGQALAAAKLKLGSALESALSIDVRRSLEDAQALLTQSIEATRTLTFQLGSAVLTELGLEAALQQLVEWFDAENHDTRFVFAADKQPKPVNEDQALMLYDIARELLFNAVKYAQAGTVCLNVEREDNRLHLIVEDNGVGFDKVCLDDGLSAEGGFGYFSIRERLSYLGGKLEVESSLGHGTRVVAMALLHES